MERAHRLLHDVTNRPPRLLGDAPVVGILRRRSLHAGINFRAVYLLARYALPEINRNPGGAFVRIGSITVPYAGAGMHLGANRALDGYAEAVFEDVREYGTKVCTIRPGYVNTKMARSDRLDASRMIQTDEIARTVLYVLAMPATACPTEIVIRPQRSPYRSG